MSPPAPTKEDGPAPPAASGAAAGASAAEPIVDSAALLQGGRTALIRHNGATYRLHATRAGKLILTK